MPTPTVRPATVLVVESDPDSRSLYGAMLRFSGYDALVCDDPGQAAERILRVDPAAIVFGLGYPAERGIAPLRELRRNPRAAGIPLVVTATSVRPEVQSALDEIGPDAFILKPVTPTELVAELGRLIAGGACVA